MEDHTRTVSGREAARGGVSCKPEKRGAAQWRRCCRPGIPEAAACTGTAGSSGRARQRLVSKVMFKGLKRIALGSSGGHGPGVPSCKGPAAPDCQRHEGRRQWPGAAAAAGAPSLFRAPVAALPSGAVAACGTRAPPRSAGQPAHDGGLGDDDFAAYGAQAGDQFGVEQRVDADAGAQAQVVLEGSSYGGAQL